MRSLRSRIRAIAGAGAAGLLFACASGPDETEAPKPELIPAPFKLVLDHERYLPSGERLEYSVSAGIFPAGTLIFDLSRAADERARYVVVDAFTKPSLLAQLLADVGGLARTCMDPATLLPYTYSFRNLKEKDVKKRLTEFTPAQGFARTLELKSDKWKHATFKTPAATDPLASLSLLRVLALERGEAARIHVIEGVTLHLMTVERHDDEDFEEARGITVRAQRFNLRTDKLDDQGKLMNRPPENNMRVWVSDDDRRVILRSEGRTKAGNVTIRLLARTLRS